MEAADSHPNCVPGAETAVAEDEKFLEYLLNPSHRRGRYKASFFARLGFDETNWGDLRVAILVELPHVEGHFGRVNLANGENWYAEMRIQGPSGEADIVTVWAVNPKARTRLVTAYPV